MMRREVMIVMAIVMVVTVMMYMITPTTTIIEVEKKEEEQQQTATALEMTGQQYFANGTGIAYFEDGTTESFIHTITPEEGYYHDNSTAFVYGNIPGYEGNITISNTNVKADELDAIAETGGGSSIINVTIPSGATILANSNGSRAIQPSNIIHAKVGDIIFFSNEDYENHWLVSPPDSFSGPIPTGGNFDLFLGTGQNGTVVVTAPVGLHFFDKTKYEIKGAIIVE
jgi:hypothetical protein